MNQRRRFLNHDILGVVASYLHHLDGSRSTLRGVASSFREAVDRECPTLLSKDFHCEWTTPFKCNITTSKSSSSTSENGEAQSGTPGAEDSTTVVRWQNTTLIPLTDGNQFSACDLECPEEEANALFGVELTETLTDLLPEFIEEAEIWRDCMTGDDVRGLVVGVNAVVLPRLVSVKMNNLLVHRSEAAIDTFSRQCLARAAIAGAATVLSEKELLKIPDPDEVAAELEPGDCPEFLQHPRNVNAYTTAHSKGGNVEEVDTPQEFLCDLANPTNLVGKGFYQFSHKAHTDALMPARDTYCAADEKLFTGFVCRLPVVDYAGPEVDFDLVELGVEEKYICFLIWGWPRD